MTMTVATTTVRTGAQHAKKCINWLTLDIHIRGLPSANWSALAPVLSGKMKHTEMLKIGVSLIDCLHPDSVLTIRQLY
jgi:hypothetical protein